jgi:hypothetical protein
VLVSRNNHVGTMYLTLDFGNTASKYALFSEEGILRFHGVFADVESLFAEEALR